MEIVGKIVMLTPKEYADRSGLTVHAVYAACVSGSLPHSRPTGKAKGSILISAALIDPESAFQRKLAGDA